MWCVNVDSSRIDCAEVLNLLERYVDREVSSHDEARIAWHLGGCEECLDRKEFRQRVREILRRKCSSEALPPGLEERIRSRLAGPA